MHPRRGLLVLLELRRLLLELLLLRVLSNMNSRGLLDVTMGLLLEGNIFLSELFRCSQTLVELFSREKHLIYSHNAGEGLLEPLVEPGLQKKLKKVPRRR